VASETRHAGRRVAAGLGLALALLLVAPAHAEPLYELEWQSFARKVRADGDGADVATESGEQRGRATARLVALPSGDLRLEFRGEEGSGSGVIGRAGPREFTFPTPIAVGVPRAPAHLISGTFEPRGDPREPQAFRVHYIEGFICHAAPDRCSHVLAWERQFTATATRIAEPAQPSPADRF
jgi:hypothetical protein